MKGKAIILHKFADKGWAEAGRVMTTSKHPLGVSHIDPARQLRSSVVVPSDPCIFVSLMPAAPQMLWKPLFLFSCIKAFLARMV